MIGIVPWHFEGIFSFDELVLAMMYLELPGMFANDTLAFVARHNFRPFRFPACIKQKASIGTMGSLLRAGLAIRHRILLLL
ncbi:MAG TPA: hypothetical protein VGM63_06150, partial [Mucilaginibacter sp.]